EEKIKEYILFKNLDGKYLTLQDCLDENKEKHENTVFYVTDVKAQSQYINMFREAGLDAVMLGHNIDSAFIGQLEQKNEGVKFLRIDADLNDVFKEEVAEEHAEAFKEDTEKLTAAFKKALNNEKLEIKVEKLKNENLSSMITISEESRRMQDMMKMYNMYGMDPSMFGGAGETLVLNANNSLVKYVLEHEDGEQTGKICEQLYDMALLSHGSLSPERMTQFLTRSNDIMMLMLEK
ncbi:MAG: molecular chaperone HtpG, partial [Hungatella sp.]